MRAALSTLALALLTLASATAWSQGAVWGETVVTTETPVQQTEEPDQLAPGEARVEGQGWSVDPTGDRAPRVISADDLPQTSTFAEVEALNARIRGATVPVRAIFRRDPLFVPDTIEVVGAATLVDMGDGEPILLTASHLVSGAERVEVESASGWIAVETTLDADFGLAIIDDAGDRSVDLTAGREALSLSRADADEIETAYGAGSTAPGATMGRGADQYAFYQVNTSGSVLGNPLVNRDGHIIGIGSHRHPGDPAFSLSVPADKVREFLAQ